MAFIKLKDHIYAEVDDEDNPRLSKYRYYASRTRHLIYATRKYQKNRVIYYFLLHYDVLNITPKDIKPLVIDHINRNPLNCKKSNLRLCTRSQNCCNRRPSKNKTSKYKGVSYTPGSGKYRRKKPWLVVLQKERKQYRFGYFPHEYAAYKKANVEAFRLFRRFAYLAPWTGPTRLCKNCGVFKQSEETGG